LRDSSLMVRAWAPLTTLRHNVPCGAMNSRIRDCLVRCLLLAATTSSSAFAAERQASLSVGVASNMKPAFEEIVREYQARHRGISVIPIYGASGTFLAQISNGAPLDLFLSADAEFPAKVVERGLADGKAFTYAYGKLVVWVPKSSPLDLDAKGFAALADPSVRKIAMANPEVAPYGRAAREALEKAGLLRQLQDRIVYGQNVSQAAQFVQSGNAQAGLVPLSLANVPPLSVDGRAWIVPASDYAPIEQAGVILKSSAHLALARELVSFITGRDGAKILEKHGYVLPTR